ncbi:S-adenosyl-L-methionine-dependent methyltransferase [Fomitiporia mediterranea MF3/22]|uniref:S-adenosyl-L-methionine-dependent methyltransferase n=1 Tax=Fomitiporia mediterranea (strain MF3/22) TaxID=694068 RepID=UPI00044099E0|nr:S-adenosyl-L-methionine-dependent methyltransferase [Fomitiporia mediterranea MF3/22]EJC99588.1 S-adenosyl-L-methionine-dependent methyltransferase [Fomitiporia mediterranea MF3/22]
MSTDLEALSDIIASSVGRIVGICKETGKEIPIADSINFAVAAAAQLIATLQSPPIHLWNSAFKFVLPGCLGIAENANVAEILRDAGPEGMHAEEIAKRSGVHARKLYRVMRMLASNHYFREVDEKTYAHNLLSSLLDTGKPLIENFNETKHVNTAGFAAVAGYGADEIMLAAHGLREAMLDPKTAHSEEIDESGFQRAMKVKLPMWDIYEMPEQHYRRDRFNVFMSNATTVHPETILSAFNWEEVPNGVLVDVGSGTGHVSLEVAKKHPDMTIVLEDRTSVIEQAKTYWKEHLTSHVSMGKVHFIDTNFLDQQPALPATPDVFLLRWILHDWPDKYAIRILKCLRNAAVLDKTKLVILESIPEYACKSNTGFGKGADASGCQKPPAPLLSNLGEANMLSYLIDFLVLIGHNAGGRTVQEFPDIFKVSDWKLSKVERLSGGATYWSSISAVPDPSYNHRASLLSDPFVE